MLRRAALLGLFSVLGLAGAASSMIASGAARGVDPTTTSATTPATNTFSPTGATTTFATTPVAASTATTTKSTTTAKTATPVTTTTTTSVPAVQLNPTTTSTSPTTIVLSGHGWGHGMGMSQWGAYGYALHGWTYDAILGHYYSGTTLGPDPPATLRVLLADGVPRATLDSAADWRVVDAAGTTVSLPPGKLVLDPSLTVAGSQLVAPLTFVPGTAPLQFGSIAYRGKLLVTSAHGKLQIVNRVGIEAYVRGVVPAEVPSTWPPEALKAQAVAARSYALSILTTVVKASNYDVFGDGRDQVYGGMTAETPATTAAVTATAHQVVLYGGTIATTYFSSSSGGRTVSALEATGTAVPYLVSVPDPYDSYATNHTWGPVLFGADQIAKMVGLKGPLVDLLTMDGPSRHVSKVTAIGAGGSVVLSGAALRSDLGLRSTWFSVGWLALAPQPAPMKYGAGATLTGIARGVKGVVLESKALGGAWQAVSPVLPDSNGAFTSVVRPDATTQYRLTAGNLNGALVKLAVVPVVEASAVSGSVAGTIRPVLPGAPVQLQLQGVTGWTTVASAATDAAGSFVLPAALVPGTYRVRSSPGHGLSPGFSDPLVVA